MRFLQIFAINGGFREGSRPMGDLAHAVCAGANPANCAELVGVYQYLGEKWAGDSCGVEQGRYCTQGSQAHDRFALCTR